MTRTVPSVSAGMGIMVVTFSPPADLQNIDHGRAAGRASRLGNLVALELVDAAHGW